MLARLFAVFLLALGLTMAGPASAENATPYSGTQVIDTGKPFAAYVDALRDVIKESGFVIVGLACANCAIKSRFGEEVPGNRVFLFFRPEYAKRMLEASTAAGIEAPIRVYVTEAADGSATVTYRLPSHVFGAYEVEALTEMGHDLDRDVAQILAQAAAAS